MEYSVSLQTPQILLLTIKCLCITHVLRDEFKEKSFKWVFNPQTKHPGPGFCPFTCKTCPSWVCECSKVGAGSTSSSTGVQCRTEGAFILSWGVIPAQIEYFFSVWKCSVAAGTCSGHWVCKAESESPGLWLFSVYLQHLDLVEFIQFGHWEIRIIFCQE